MYKKKNTSGTCEMEKNMVQLPVRNGKGCPVPVAPFLPSLQTVEVRKGEGTMIKRSKPKNMLDYIVQKKDHIFED